MAWLNCSAKDATKSRRAQIDANCETTEEEPDYQLPDTGEGEFLVSMISELGEAKLSGGHVASIDWVDINAWINATGAEITPWEASAMKTLSSVYVAQHYEASGKNCMSPNIEKLQGREVVAGKIKSLFAMLRN